MDELLAEVDAARDVARKAVESGEQTLREANETLQTLLGRCIWIIVQLSWTIQQFCVRIQEGEEMGLCVCMCVCVCACVCEIAVHVSKCAYDCMGAYLHACGWDCVCTCSH